MKIVVIGASGLLGSVLVPKLELISNEVITLGWSASNHYRCDVGNRASINHTLDILKPSIIINLVALTDIDLCESDPRQAFKVNVQILENIVSWIETSSRICHLVQISTDHVYDGMGPHLESQVMLTNYYAFSKYAAELVALRVSATVLRTNFFGKSKRDKKVSFTDWIIKNIKDNEFFFLFNDVFFSPLSMETLAKMISIVITEKPQGVYNLGSREGLSKSAFALLFADKLNLESSNMKATSIDDVTFMKTYRPKDMRMDVTKFEKHLGVSLPTLEDEIDSVIDDYYETA